MQNRYNSLFIYLESTQAQSEQFLQEILHNPPPNAVIQGYTISQTPALTLPCSDFKILSSSTNKQDDMLFLPQDLAICQACLNDMRQDSRFKDYAFANLPTLWG